MQPFRRLTEAFDRSVRAPWQARKARRRFEGEAWDALDPVLMLRLAEDFPGAMQWKDKHGATLLHFAAKAQRADICEVLIGRGAALDAADKRGFTPLHHAAQCGNWVSIKSGPEKEDPAATVKVLLKAGANIEARNVKDRTPLMRAMKYNSPAAVEALVLAGADVTAKDETGATPVSRMEANPSLPPATALRKVMAEMTARAEEKAKSDESERKRLAAEEAAAAAHGGLTGEVKVARLVRLKK
jgi:ankyrin repeat protein